MNAQNVLVYMAGIFLVWLAYVLVVDWLIVRIARRMGWRIAE